MGVVTVVGSANLDVILRVAAHPERGETILALGQDQGPGGKGFNQAVAARASGAATQFVARVGNDQPGEYLRNQAVSEGLDTQWISIDPNLPTGTAYIILSQDSENSIIVSAGANGGLAHSDVEAAPASDVVLAQLEVPHAAVAHGLAQAQVNNALSILNAAPAAKFALELFPQVDIAIVNETEAGFFGGVARIRALVRQGVVLTRGARGAQWHGVDGEVINVSAFSVDAVDTTGAGDAFCGAFAARLAAGERVEEALRYSSAAGALATTAVGAQGAMPRYEDVLAFMRNAAYDELEQIQPGSDESASNQPNANQPNASQPSPDQSVPVA